MSDVRETNKWFLRGLFVLQNGLRAAGSQSGRRERHQDDHVFASRALADRLKSGESADCNDVSASSRRSGLALRRGVRPDSTPLWEVSLSTCGRSGREG